MSAEGENSLSLNRRRYLMGAAAASVGSLSVMTGSATAADRHEIQFDRVVDAVDDLGMDPTGNQPIDSALQSSLDRGNELVKFPEGEYLVSGGVSASNVNNWGVLGLGSSPGDVRFLHTGSGSLVFLRTSGGSGHLVENVTMDYSTQKSGAVGIHLFGHDQVYTVDVHFEGFNPTASNGDLNNLSVHILSTTGEGLIEGVVRKGPSAIASHASQGSPSNSPVSWLGPNHEGTLTYRDCHFENAGANVIYASRTNGTIQVEDSTFVNNNQSSVRISGKDSYVRNCEFVIDTDNAHPENTYPEGDYINPHAMQWESGTEGRSGADIIDCEIVYRSRPDNGRFLRGVRAIGSIGGFDVRNTRFRLETDNTAAIWAQDPENPSFGATPVQPWDITLDGVSITGTGHANRGAVELHSRSDSVVTECCLHLTGSQDGIVITDSHGCRIEHTSITTNGEETVFSSADVETHDITTGESCPLPDFSDGDDDGEDSNGTHDDVHSTDFSEQTVGETPTGWSGRWETSEQFAISDSPSPHGDRRVDIDPSATADRYGLAWDDVAETADAEILALVRVPSADQFNSAAFARATVRGGTESGEERGVMLDMFTPENDDLDNYWEVSWYGSDGSVNEAASWGNPQPDTWYWIRLNVNGTDVQAKTWEYGTDEPGWDADTTITHSDFPTSAGWIGLSQFAGHESHVDYVSVDEAGENAPMPDEESRDDDETDDDESDDDNNEDDDTEEPELNELVIHGPGRNSDVTRIDYRIAYDGEATPLTGREENINDGYFEGSVWLDYTDSFEIDGEVTEVEMLSDEATLEYNGEVVEQGDFPIDDDDESDDLPHAILVDGTVTDEVTSYSIAVTGELEPSEELSEGQDRSDEDGLPDSVSDGTVEGVVKEGIDGYYFSGNITQMHIDGNASIDLSIE